MAASTRTRPSSQSKTAQTYSSPAPPFFARKIMPKPLASCEAISENYKDVRGNRQGFCWQGASFRAGRLRKLKNGGQRTARLTAADSARLRLAYLCRTPHQ